MKKKYTQRDGTFYFGDGNDLWTAPNPRSGAMWEAAWTARYNQEKLSPSHIYRILSSYEVYNHLLSPDITTNKAIEKLRILRRAVGES